MTSRPDDPLRTMPEWPAPARAGAAPLFDLGTHLALLDALYPRLLSQVDRDPDSPTYGSCDRGFWMYRLHDFDSGVFQQASLTFAALVRLAERADLFACRHLRPQHATAWRALAAAINARTVRLLAARGSLDEYYPGERSFPATSFAAYATLRSALWLDQRDVVEHAGLARAARWLATGRSPSPAANQDAAAAAFLALFAETNGGIGSEARRTAQALLERGQEPGLFLEYGGIDLGYLSVSLDYLAHIDVDGTLDVRARALAAARRLAAFLTPSGRLGGEFASRNTTYWLPFGLLWAARADAELAACFARADLAGTYEKLDDRYLMHYCLPSLACAALSLAEAGPPAMAPLAPEPVRIRHEEIGGLLAVGCGESTVLVGLRKGGAVQTETPAGVDIDCGYRLEWGGRRYATCVLDEEAQPEVIASENEVEVRVEARFLRYGVLTASPLKTIVLRLLSFAGPLLSRYFKRVLIARPEALDGVRLHRRVHVDLAVQQLAIEDRIEGLRPGQRLSRAPASSLRLVPSAKFFQVGEEEAYARALEPLESTGPWRRVIPFAPSLESIVDAEGNR